MSTMRKRRVRKGPTKSYCRWCWDGDRHSVFPHYGVGPHVCGFRMGKPVIGHSKPLARELWPENFQLDDEYPTPPGRVPVGVWTHCPHCGAGHKEKS
jgi:hypothetical protein